MVTGSETNVRSDVPAGGPLVDIIIARLSALQSGQDAMNSALGLMIDTLRAQTNLLRKLNEYATDEPATSPITKVLGELTSAIMDLDASIGSMEMKFDRLSDTIAAAYKAEVGTLLPPPANGEAT